MRTPLPIRASGKVSSDAVYVMQALHLLDLTSEDRLLNAGHAVDQSDRRTVAVVRTMLEYGARVQSISPIVPEKILGDDGLQHLADVFRDLAHEVSPELVATAAQQMLPGLKTSMRIRLTFAQAYEQQYSHECRLGVMEDIEKALANDHIVGAETLHGGILFLILPGTNGSECTIFNPVDGSLTPTQLLHASLHSRPFYSIYSRQR